MTEHKYPTTEGDYPTPPQGTQAFDFDEAIVEAVSLYLDGEDESGEPLDEEFKEYLEVSTSLSLQWERVRQARAANIIAYYALPAELRNEIPDHVLSLLGVK